MINNEGFTVTPISDSTAFIGAYDLERTTSVIPSSAVISGRTFKIVEIGGFLAPKLTSVTIPSSVTVLGPSAFIECANLTSITIPSTVTTIGGSAFHGAGLTSVTIPESVTSIDGFAFVGCSALTQINYNAIHATTSNYWIAGVESTLNTVLTQINIGPKVQVLPDYFAARCSKVESVVIPPTVTRIGKHAFSQTSLSSVTIPSPLTSMGDSAFYKCVNLKTFMCKHPIDTIGESVLNRADSVTTIVAPADIFNSKYSTSAKIENATITGGHLEASGMRFLSYSKSSLKSVDISNVSNGYLIESIFANFYKLEKLALPINLVLIEDKSFSGCGMLKTIAIPATVRGIGNRAFENCTRLETISFGSSATASKELTIVGDNAFYNCSNLKSLNLPESVKRIGTHAFYRCSSMKTLILPSTLLSIEDSCFAYCFNINTMIVRAQDPPVIAANTFFDVNREIPVYVPDYMQILYTKDDNWKTFFGIAPLSTAPSAVTYTIQTDSKPYTISMENNILTIDNPTDLPVSVYDMQGRLVGTSTPFTLSNNVYIVKIGNYTETIR